MLEIGCLTWRADPGAIRELLWREDVLEDRQEAAEAAKEILSAGSQFVTPKKRNILSHKAM
jgi:hypothetical protein